MNWRGRRHPWRVAQVLHHLDAQIIGLQELESTKDDGRAPARLDDGDQAASLADALGYQLVRGPTLSWGTTSYGNGLLSAFPVITVNHIDLSVGGTQEPRGAVDAVVAVGSHRVRVLVTHLGLRWWERRQQIEVLASAARRDTLPLIVLGDLNEWRPGARRTLRRLGKRLGPYNGSPRTFPSACPLFSLDRVLVRPAAALVELKTVRTPLSRVASDHLPLRAIIDLQDLRCAAQASPGTDPPSA